MGSSEGDWRRTMARAKGTIRAQRSAEVRAKWAAHVATWQACGGRQSDYCRGQGLDPKYFSIWKGRLAKIGDGDGDAATPQLMPRLVPVVVTAAPAEEHAAGPDSARGDGAEFCVGVTLPNGIAVNIRMPSARELTPLLSELSRLSC
jgi:hypothetical protein